MAFRVRKRAANVTEQPPLKQVKETPKKEFTPLPDLILDVEKLIGQNLVFDGTEWIFQKF